jgi:hypothetical protein
MGPSVAKMRIKKGERLAPVSPMVLQIIRFADMRKGACTVCGNFDGL